MAKKIHGRDGFVQQFCTCDTFINNCQRFKRLFGSGIILLTESLLFKGYLSACLFVCLFVCFLFDLFFSFLVLPDDESRCKCSAKRVKSDAIL